MKKLLTLIATMIMCNAYGDTNAVIWAAGAATSASTCDDGGNITKPDDPTKEGYKFKGWNAVSVPDEVGDFITFLVTNTTTAANSSYPTSDDGTTYWKATWNNYGYLRGEGRCSVDGGSEQLCYGNISRCIKSDDPSTSAGSYCWCRATYIQTNSSKYAYLPSSMPWLMTRTFDSSSQCRQQCIRYCGVYVKSYSNYRRAILGVTQ